MMPVKTSAERQAKLRLRRAEEGLTEVRGVYAKATDHSKIKAYAKSLRKIAATAKKT